jgi:cytochrome oxidase Cu insertion factor (SCO1/SenC/PrrC family)
MFRDRRTIVRVNDGPACHGRARSLRRTAAALAGISMLLAGSQAQAATPVDWSLRTVNGSSVTIRDMPAKWLLVYFGYTYCPDICPTALSEMTAVLQQLGAAADRIAPIFITIDPDRDTPELLTQYVANFDARITPLTGTAEQIAAATREFHFHYVRYQDPSVAQYSFDHSSAFFLVDPRRWLVDDFAAPDLTAEEIAASLRERLEPARLAEPPETGRVQ